MTDFLSYVDKDLNDKKGTQYVKPNIGWNIEGNIFENGRFIIKKWEIVVVIPSLNIQ
jgi:hypothetical protein